MIKYTEEGKDKDNIIVIEDDNMTISTNNSNNNNNNDENTNTLIESNNKEIPWFHPYFSLLGSFNSVSKLRFNNFNTKYCSIKLNLNNRMLIFHNKF